MYYIHSGIVRLDLNLCFNRFVYINRALFYRCVVHCEGVVFHVEHVRVKQGNGLLCRVSEIRVDTTNESA